MPIRHILVARIDGLALCATMAASKEEEALLEEYKRFSKSVLKRISTLPLQATITANELALHYIIQGNIFLLLITDKSYPRLLGFSCLLEIEKTFLHDFTNADIQSAIRPYACIRFEPFLQNIRKRYMNTRSLRTQEDLSELSSKIRTVPVFQGVDIVGTAEFESIFGSTSLLKSVSGSQGNLFGSGSGSGGVAGASEEVARAVMKKRLTVSLSLVVAFLDFLYGFAHIFGVDLLGLQNFELEDKKQTHSFYDLANIFTLALLSPALVVHAYYVFKNLQPLPYHIPKALFIHAILTITQIHSFHMSSTHPILFWEFILAKVMYLVILALGIGFDTIVSMRDRGIERLMESRWRILQKFGTMLRERVGSSGNKGRYTD